MKFRVYDERQKQMFYPQEVEDNNWALGSNGIMLAVDADSFKKETVTMFITEWRRPMFYVGRLDRKGHEIFQGDILKFILDPTLAETVTYGKPEMHFIVGSPNSTTTIFNGEFEYDLDILSSPAVLSVEIVGNIYEDLAKFRRFPELMTVLEDEDDDGWIGDTVKCDLCSHTWTAVYHEDTEKLECPNCDNMTHFESITEEEDGE